MSDEHAAEEGHERRSESKDPTLGMELAPIENIKNSTDDDLESGSGEVVKPDVEKADDSARSPVDPNVVDWHGPSDPANPLNWPKYMRIGHVVLISMITLVA